MSMQDSVQIFLSYCEQDERWVEKFLFPRLRSAKINMIEFVIGRPKVLEIERAIRESKFTLLVISQNYLENSWGKFASLLTTTFSANFDTWKTLPILIEKCSLPPDLDRVVSLNLSEPTEEKWQQLLRRILEDQYVEQVNASSDKLKAMDPSLNDLIRQLKGFQEQIQHFHTSLRITKPCLTQIQAYLAQMKQFLTGLKKKVSEEKSDTWNQFDKINVDHILHELQTAENQMVVGIRLKSSAQKNTCLRQIKQSLSSAGESLRYLENMLKIRL